MANAQPNRERRASLGVFASGFALSSLRFSNNASATSLRGVFIGGGRYQDGPNDSAKHVLSHVALHEDGTLDVLNIPTSFFPHGFAIDPREKSRVIAFEKIGPGSCEFDLSKRSLIRPLAPAANRIFYGHGVFSADGSRLYATEINLMTGEGLMAVYDGKTLKYLGDFPTFGSHPHDCSLTANGKVLVVTNGGDDEKGPRKPNVSYIDLATYQLIAQWQVPDKAFNAGHVQLTPDDSSIVISAPRRGLSQEFLGAIHRNDYQTKNQTMRRAGKDSALADKLFGEALSCTLVAEKDFFAVTHPTPGLLTFWKLSTLEHIKTIPLARVRGLALTDDRKELIAAYGPKVQLARIGVSSLDLVGQQPTTSTLISGSHLLNYRA
jgi:uncharacterized protein